MKEVMKLPKVTTQIQKIFILKIYHPGMKMNTTMIGTGNASREEQAQRYGSAYS